VAPSIGGFLYKLGGLPAVFGIAASLLSVDIILRFLLIEKKLNATPIPTNDDFDEDSSTRSTERTVPASQYIVDEGHPLLPNNDYKVIGKPKSMVLAFPVLYCFRNPRMLTAMTLSLVHGSFIGIFEATVPTEAAVLFHISSFQVGLVFTSLVVPYVMMGPVAGHAVDKYGTKLVTVCGYSFLTVCLAMMGVPAQELVHGRSKIILFCIVLAFNGVGLSVISSTSFVEANLVTSKYEEANPGFFGESGPYAQIFAFNSMFMFVGMTVGPIVGGTLRAKFGYGVMGLVFATISGISAILSFFLIGEKGD
jgi:hypothetical protein